ncbi:MAG: pentapeptide repeat-containing protein [Rhodocyclaceae bacterium]
MNSLAKASLGSHPPNSRRRNFWEPIFSQNALESFPSFDWKTNNITGIYRQTCDANQLKELRESTHLPVLRNFKFSECDFLGIFDLGPFAFKDCTFNLCDLGRSTWRNIKFQNCKFLSCTFTQSTLDSCQFTKCIWEKIGFSGTETHIRNCLFTNPAEFVYAGYTNLDPQILSRQQGDLSKATHQVMRLEQTKLKISRLILNSQETQGNDTEYYQSIKTYLTLSVDAQIAEVRHELFEKKRPIFDRVRYLFLHLERLILSASGVVNDWGASLARPALIGVGLVAAFAIYYRFIGIQDSLLNAFFASFDVTTLIGYTKHANKDGHPFEQLSYMVNMFFGLWWYSVFVPTVINRISRVRA